MRAFHLLAAGLLALGLPLLAADTATSGVPASLPADGYVSINDSSGMTANTCRLALSGGKITVVTVYVPVGKGKYVKHQYTLATPLPTAGLDLAQFFSDVIRPLMQNPTQLPQAVTQILGQTTYVTEELGGFGAGLKLLYSVRSPDGA